MSRGNYRPEGDPLRHHRCACLHLDAQHGPAEHPSSRPGCWWCDCVTYQPRSNT